jgi:HEAT repeat protein
MSEQECITALEATSVPLGVRRAVLAKLATNATDASLDVLRRSVEDPDLQCQVRAVFALSHLASDGAVDALARCLTLGTGPRFTFAARELGRTGSPRARTALVRALATRADELDNGDKRVLITALSRMPHREEVSVLQKMLYRSGRRVRAAAATVLGQIRAPESADALREAAGSLGWWQRGPIRRALRQHERTAL